MNIQVLIFLCLFATVYGGCQIDFQQVNQSCYHFNLADYYTWFDAYKTCIDLNATLAELETLEKIDNMRNFLTHHIPYANFSFYIGGSDMNNEGNWVWMHSLKPIVINDWCAPEPNNYGIENCLVLSNKCQYGWEDKSCLTQHNGYICEGKPQAYNEDGYQYDIEIY